MVICLFVGCMCSPCVRRRSPVKTFREPMGNSLVLLQTSLSGMSRQNKPLGLGLSVCPLRFWHVWTLCPWMRCSNSVVRLRRRLRRSIHRPSVSSCLARPLVLSSRLPTQQSHNTACSPPQRRLRRQHRYLAFLGTPRPLFLLRRGQVSPSRQPSSLLRSLVPPPRGLFSQLLSLLRSLVPPPRGLFLRLCILVAPPRGLLTRPRSLVWPL